MKKTLSAILVVVLAMTALCAGALAFEPGGVVGDWYFNVLEQDGMLINPTAYGMGMTLTLHDDGTALMTQGDEEGDAATWKIEGDVLTVEDEESALEFFLVDGNLVTDMGGDGKMTFGRELIVEQTHADFPVVAAADIAEFDGEWTGDLVEMYGMKLPMDSEVMGMEMSLVIHNGEITVHSVKAGMDPEESVIQGALEEGTLVTEYTQYGEAERTVLSLREDGSLSFVAGEEGMMVYYFVKAE